MARYLAALLGGGANEHGPVLRPATLATMFEPHYQPDPPRAGRRPGVLAGHLGGHLAVEHQGILPGFNSQIFLAPDDGVGVMAFTNGASGARSGCRRGRRAAQPADRRPGRGRSAPMFRTIPRSGVTSAAGTRFRPATDQARASPPGRRGLRAARPAHASGPEPLTRGVPRLRAAPRRRQGPVRVPDRPIRVWPWHRQDCLQPRTGSRDDANPPRPVSAFAPGRQPARTRGTGSPRARCGGGDRHRAAVRRGWRGQAAVRA